MDEKPDTEREARASETQSTRLPGTVRASVVLMGVVVLLQGLVALVFLLEGQDALRGDVVERRPDGSTSDGDAAVIGAFVPFIGFVVLFVLLARKIVQGRNWARIITIVIAVLLALGSLVSGAEGVQRMIPRLGLLVCVALVVLLLSGPSRKHCAPQGTAGQGDLP